MDYKPCFLFADIDRHDLELAIRITSSRPEPDFPIRLNPFRERFTDRLKAARVAVIESKSNGVCLTEPALDLVVQAVYVGKSLYDWSAKMAGATPEEMRGVAPTLGRAFNQVLEGIPKIATEKDMSDLFPAFSPQALKMAMMVEQMQEELILCKLMKTVYKMAEEVRVSQAVKQ